MFTDCCPPRQKRWKKLLIHYIAKLIHLEVYIDEHRSGYSLPRSPTERVYFDFSRCPYKKDISP